MISEREDQVEVQALQDQYNERIKNIEGYRKEIKRLQKEGGDNVLFRIIEMNLKSHRRYEFAQKSIE